MNSQVYILLPVHNRRAITEEFIDCLVAQSYSNYHLILIDDGSTDGTSEMVQAKVPNLTVLRGKGDWWWAGSLQQGINWLNHNDAKESDIVVFSNDDITIGPEFLQIGVCLLNEQNGMLLPQVFNVQTGKIEESGIEIDMRKFTMGIASDPERINCLATRGLFMRMSDIRKVGNFFPWLLPHYLSDYEFTIRAFKSGVRLATSPKLVIISDDAATGVRTFDGLSFMEFLKRFFSIKSPFCPLYWTAFVLLASPKLYIPINILRVWVRAAKVILRHGQSICFGRR
jgi:GT2 family glycosyltransferase